MEVRFSSSLANNQGSIANNSDASLTAEHPKPEAELGVRRAIPEGEALGIRQRSPSRSWSCCPAAFATPPAAVLGMVQPVFGIW